ncbi:MAG: hypothetical protein GY719_39095 [bacterium]|nr:hypothetical protein [bacterium]
MPGRILMSAVILSLVLLALAAAGAEMATGKPELKSAGQLAFGPGDVLFVADSAGTAVHAFDLKDSAKPSGEELPSIDEIDEKVASLLGTTARDVLIQDIAVHPGSKNVYLSVSRGRGDDAAPAVVKVDVKGQLSLVDLKGATATSAMITNAPAADAKTRRGNPMRALTITDIAFHDGHLYVAGLSNEEFASNLRKIPYPFSGEMDATSVEIYHGAHGKFETHAPIRTLMPYESGGQAHLLAAYTCTPLVTFPLDKLEDGAHLKGTTIAELGFGNAPLDMIQFDKEGEPYVLILNSSRGGMRIKASDIDKAGPISTDTDVTRDEPLVGVPYLTVPMGGILRADNYNDDKLVVLRRDLDTGSLQLRLWTTAWI